MINVIALLCIFCVWAALFKKFFKDFQGFRHGAKCAFFSGAYYLRWSSNNEFEANMGAAIKFIAWFVIGSVSGYLVKLLLENVL